MDRSCYTQGTFCAPFFQQEHSDTIEQSSLPNNLRFSSPSISCTLPALRNMQTQYMYTFYFAYLTITLSSMQGKADHATCNMQNCHHIPMWSVVMPAVAVALILRSTHITVTNQCISFYCIVNLEQQPFRLMTINIEQDHEGIAF